MSKIELKNYTNIYECETPESGVIIGVNNNKATGVGLYMKDEYGNTYNIGLTASQYGYIQPSITYIDDTQPVIASYMSATISYNIELNNDDEIVRGDADDIRLVYFKADGSGIISYVPYTTTKMTSKIKYKIEFFVDNLSLSTDYIYYFIIKTNFCDYKIINSSYVFKTAHKQPVITNIAPYNVTYKDATFAFTLMPGDEKITGINLYYNTTSYSQIGSYNRQLFVYVEDMITYSASINLPSQNTEYDYYYNITTPENSYLYYADDNKTLFSTHTLEYDPLNITYLNGKRTIYYNSIYLENTINNPNNITIVSIIPCYYTSDFTYMTADEIINSGSVSKGDIIDVINKTDASINFSNKINNLKQNTIYYYTFIAKTEYGYINCCKPSLYSFRTHTLSIGDISFNNATLTSINMIVSNVDIIKSDIDKINILCNNSVYQTDIYGLKNGVFIGNLTNGTTYSCEIDIYTYDGEKLQYTKTFNTLSAPLLNLIKKTTTDNQAILYYDYNKSGLKHSAVYYKTHNDTNYYSDEIINVDIVTISGLTWSNTEYYYYTYVEDNDGMTYSTPIDIFKTSIKRPYIIVNDKTDLSFKSVNLSFKLISAGDCVIKSHSLSWALGNIAYDNSGAFDTLYNYIETVDDNKISTINFQLDELKPNSTYSYYFTIYTTDDKYSYYLDPNTSKPGDERAFIFTTTDEYNRLEVDKYSCVVRDNRCILRYIFKNTSNLNVISITPQYKDSGVEYIKLPTIYYNKITDATIDTGDILINDLNEDTIYSFNFIIKTISSTFTIGDFDFCTNAINNTTNNFTSIASENYSTLTVTRNYNITNRLLNDYTKIDSSNIIKSGFMLKEYNYPLISTYSTFESAYNITNLKFGIPYVYNCFVQTDNLTKKSTDEIALTAPYIYNTEFISSTDSSITIKTHVLYDTMIDGMTTTCYYDYGTSSTNLNLHTSIGTIDGMNTPITIQQLDNTNIYYIRPRVVITFLGQNYTYIGNNVTECLLVNKASINSITYSTTSTSVSIDADIIKGRYDIDKITIITSDGLYEGVLDKNNHMSCLIKELKSNNTYKFNIEVVDTSGEITTSDKFQFTTNAIVLPTISNIVCDIVPYADTITRVITATITKGTYDINNVMINGDITSIVTLNNDIITATFSDLKPSHKYNYLIQVTDANKTDVFSDKQSFTTYGVVVPNISNFGLTYTQSLATITASVNRETYPIDKIYVYIDNIVYKANFSLHKADELNLWIATCSINNLKASTTYNYSLQATDTKGYKHTTDTFSFSTLDNIAPTITTIGDSIKYDRLSGINYTEIVLEKNITLGTSNLNYSGFNITKNGKNTEMCNFYGNREKDYSYSDLIKGGNLLYYYAYAYDMDGNYTSLSGATVTTPILYNNGIVDDNSKDFSISIETNYDNSTTYLIKSSTLQITPIKTEWDSTVSEPLKYKSYISSNYIKTTIDNVTLLSGNYKYRNVMNILYYDNTATISITDVYFLTASSYISKLNISNSTLNNDGCAIYVLQTIIDDIKNRSNMSIHQILLNNHNIDETLEASGYGIITSSLMTTINIIMPDVKKKSTQYIQNYEQNKYDYLKYGIMIYTNNGVDYDYNNQSNELYSKFIDIENSEDGSLITSDISTSYNIRVVFPYITNSSDDTTTDKMIDDCKNGAVAYMYINTGDCIYKSDYFYFKLNYEV